MRYMIIVKATKDSEAGVLPPEHLLAQMAAFHGELAKAGVLVDGSGLQATSKGWRVRYRGANRTVIDGPFAETKELIAGYTIINVKSRAEAIEWTKKFPNPTLDGSDCEIEVRQMFELEDFGDERDARPLSRDRHGAAQRSCHEIRLPGMPRQGGVGTAERGGAGGARSKLHGLRPGAAAKGHFAAGFALQDSAAATTVRWTGRQGRRSWTARSRKPRKCWAVSWSSKRRTRPRRSRS